MFYETNFECSVCLEYFDEPKQLHCGHSICERCVVELSNETSRGVVIECPECRKLSIAPVIGFPTNYALKNLTEQFVANNRLHKNCSFCNGQKISVCENCLGNGYQVLHGKPSKLRGRWKLHSETNYSAFLAAIGHGVLYRVGQYIFGCKELTLLDLGGGTEWMVCRKSCISSTRLILKMNDEPMVLNRTRRGDLISHSRYNIANDSLERVDMIVDDVQSTLISYVRMEVLDHQLVITYQAGTGVEAERTFTRLPLDSRHL
uniref:RING-type domain-containing protein n=1 Tax=Steinernema glaseri TaxID=37863 RepID=A0A1I8ABI4_9BILA